MAALVSLGPEPHCHPAGTGPVHMNEVQCLGTEKSLWSCPFKNITQEDCKHTEDAAVRCNVPYMGYENLVRIARGCHGRGAMAPGAGCWGGHRTCCRMAHHLLCTPSHPTHFSLG